MDAKGFEQSNMWDSNYTVVRLSPLPMEPPVLFPFPLDWLNPVFFEIRDPRLMGFPMMRDVLPNIVLNAAYVLMVLVGPMIMKPFKPFNLGTTLRLYNFIMVLVSGYMLFECIHTGYISGYTMFCQPVDYSNHPLAMRMARLVWMYFFTRYVEFLDTFFFILRKKGNQISFLHVYHHTSIAITWWVTANVAAGGMMVHMVALNSFIHVIMYTYYGLSTLGPEVQKYLWWKKHLTKLQLFQFCCMLILMAGNTRCDDNNFPQFINYIGVLYCSTILALFLNFYIQTYLKQQKATKKEKTIQDANDHSGNDKEQNGTTVGNGTHKTEEENVPNGKKHN